MLKQAIAPVSLTALSKQSHMPRAIHFCVRSFYAVTPIAAYIFSTNPLEAKPNFDPFGPAHLLTLLPFSYEETILLVKVLFLFISVLAAALYTKRSIRILFFIVVLVIHALDSSYGHINHQWYPMLYTAAFLVFLPRLDLPMKKATTRQGLLLLWGAIALLFLTYTMAGTHKFVNVIAQWSAGEVHGLAPEAFLYQAAWWVPQLGKPAYLLTLIETHTYIAWFCYSFLHFMQLFAFWCVLRTRLLLPATIGFILFHTGAFLTMGVEFPPHVIVLSGLVLSSPFIDHRATLKEMYFDLPVLGWTSKKLYLLWQRI